MRKRLAVCLVLLVCVASAATAGAALDGIYKTADDAMSAYVQTYTTKSIIVILTPDLQHWHVFLDSDYRDGVDVDALNNPQEHLVMNFNETTFTAQASLTASDEAEAGALTPASSTSYSFSRQFASPDPVRSGDGLYKPNPVTTNLYLQFYETHHSVIAILTQDLVTFEVFLDSDYRDGVHASSLLPGSEDTLELTFNTGDSVDAVIQRGGGGSDSWSLSREFIAPDVSDDPGGCDVGEVEAGELVENIRDLIELSAGGSFNDLLGVGQVILDAILAGGSSGCPEVTVDPPITDFFKLKPPSELDIVVDFGTGCTVDGRLYSGSMELHLSNLDVDYSPPLDLDISGSLEATFNNLDAGADGDPLNGSISGSLDLEVSGSTSSAQISGLVAITSSNLTQGDWSFSGAGSLSFSADGTSATEIPFSLVFTSTSFVADGVPLSGAFSISGVIENPTSDSPSLEADITFNSFGVPDLSVTGKATFDGDMGDDGGTLEITTNMAVTEEASTRTLIADLIVVRDQDILTVNTSAEKTSSYGGATLTVTDLTMDVGRDCTHPTGGQVVFQCAGEDPITVTYSGCDNPPVID